MLVSEVPDRLVREGPMSSFDIDVTRDGGWWMVHIPELGGRTQAFYPREVEPMAREYIAMTTGTPIDPGGYSTGVAARCELGHAPRPAVFMFQPKSFEIITSERLHEWERLMMESVGLGQFTQPNAFSAGTHGHSPSVSRCGDPPAVDECDWV